MITQTTYTVVATRGLEARTTTVNNAAHAHQIATFSHEKEGYRPEDISISRCDYTTIIDVAVVGRQVKAIPSHEIAERLAELDQRLAMASRWNKERCELATEIERRQRQEKDDEASTR